LYYPHVREFRRYLAGAITVASVESLQAELAEILAEEYGRRFDPDLMAYTPAHPELYRDFMRSLGVTEDEWTRIPMSPGLDAMKGEIFELVQNRMEEHVLGAIIFGMEATTPYRHQCVTMGIERVMEREGIVVDHRFFSRHIDVDPRHGQSLLMPIRSWLADDARVFGLIDGAARAFSARAIFLDEVFTTLTKR